MQDETQNLGTAQEPNDAPDPSGGTPPAEDGGQTGADAGGDEIEMPPEYVGQAGVDTGVNENDIEMFPNDAGWLGADTGVDENDIEMLP